MSFKELFVSDFPLYSILPLGRGEFCVTGGGGKSKTGVPNAIEIHTLSEADGELGSKCIFRHDLGTDIIMNMVSNPNDLCTLAAGIGPSCHLLQMKKDGAGAAGKTSSVVELTKTGKMFVQTLGSIRTDFGEKDSYQKVVCFTYDGSRLVTGGMDGVVRVWKTKGLKELNKLRGHSDEIEGISCHPAKLEAVTVCRGGDANVWDLTKGKQLKRFNWGTDRKPKYRFRSCCFSPVFKEGEAPALFTINVPSRWDHRAKKDCFIIKWDSSSWSTVAVSKAGRELLSGLAVSSSGCKVAIGSTEGSVGIYCSDLKLLRRVPKVHSFSVTSLSFVSGSEGKQPKELLLSVSADRTCCVTMSKEKGNVCNWMLLFFWVLPMLVFLLSMVVLWTLVV